MGYKLEVLPWKASHQPWNTDRELLPSCRRSGLEPGESIRCRSESGGVLERKEEASEHFWYCYYTTTTMELGASPDVLSETEEKCPNEEIT